MIEYFDVLPDYNTPSGYQKVYDLGLVREHIEYWSKRNDDWSKDYVRNLEVGLRKVEMGITPYISKNGVLFEKSKVIFIRKLRRILGF